MRLADDLPLRAELLVEEREAGELVLVDAADDVVGNGRQHRLLARKFRVEIDGITCASLKLFKKSKFLVTSPAKRSNAKLTTRGLNGGRTLRCSNCSQSMSAGEKNVSKKLESKGALMKLQTFVGQMGVVAGISNNDRILSNELGIS